MVLGGGHYLESFRQWTPLKYKNLKPVVYRTVRPNTHCVRTHILELSGSLTRWPGAGGHTQGTRRKPDRVPCRSWCNATILEIITSFLHRLRATTVCRR